ncbi:hypothetical protein DFA_09715 [Cavenderia fasciculata]|uniref:Ankyrin repeat-containing protein n=1 Tax=Cavenderia fasciculata TaxID=261658 RepID=F4Q8E3_CACFS|nr:uncharacterized protein DFA_09715 [Cavenderia fasciculata]EGG16043.1 hypothetical protein DFA_09715 [Cavenderia fasciculata]|eukprot:XP_004352368.1 hypothetical protein DFA_09715 [Cavenderia fasciculata]
MKHVIDKACGYAGGHLSIVQYFFENHFDSIKLDGVSCSYLDETFYRGHMAIVNYLVREKNQYFGQRPCKIAGFICDNDILDFVLDHTKEKKSSIIKEAILGGVNHCVAHIHNHQISIQIHHHHYLKQN